MEDSNLANLSKLSDACNELDIATPGLISTDGFRWTLKEYEGLGPHMIKLERLLHASTGRPIDLRLETISDGNKREQMAERRAKPSS